MTAHTAAPADNPLLDFSALPAFDRVSPNHVQPAVEYLVARCRDTVAQLAQSPEAPTWDNFVTPLDDATEQLARAWSVVGHLNAVVNSPALREAYNGALPLVTQFWTELSQDERLFARYKALRTSSQFDVLSDAEKQSIENKLRDFRLGGAELPDDRKARYAEVQEELSTLMSSFNDNLLDATNGYADFIENPDELAGLPEDTISAAREAARKDGREGWKLTLHAPCYLPVMQYAAYRPLRERMYRAYATRASDLGANSKWDNSSNIRRILELRAETAALLGFGNYAEVSLATKMASSPSEVIGFLQDLGERSKPFAQRDWQELIEYARSALNMADVEAWDVAYVSERLRQQRYAFSDNEVKQYFPEPQVLAGLFRVIETLYGLKVQRAQAPIWHADASFYDLRNESGALVGQFYLDLYARDGKRGGAWMDDAINRRRKNGAVQHPVAFLTCNFAAPVDTGGKKRPALFTHDDVITLFHEFGHGLHQLLTEVDTLGVSGINGVEWDAVELPSQFMENFCWEWEVLKHMTRHVDTGATLSRELFDKMIAAKNFQAGMGFVRQLEFGLIDMRLHAEFDPAADVQQLINQVREAVAVVRYPPFTRMAHSFGHIFGGGYAAGYYSYKWAEVLSADAYAAFEESGVLNPETGKRFRREVLGRGGSRPAMDSFTAFRGRKPDMEPLLRHNGMKLEGGATMPAEVVADKYQRSQPCVCSR
ncbi:MAG: M3 family metallopeptidase [Betaproteobacteria bacterium]|nr:M3 family metallopeptidase [Betaproteobacteria bacterium]